MKALTQLETLLNHQNNKLKYTRKLFQEFNNCQNLIIKTTDMRLTKYLIEINYKEFKKRIDSSQLSDGKEKSYTYNVLKSYKK